MSHAVQPHEVAALVADYGDTPFLLHPGANNAIRANHVRIAVQKNSPVVRVTGFGRRAAKAASQGVPFSLLWPSPVDGGFSLIVDGTGEIVDDEALSITVTSGVLHRPAPEPDGPDSC